MSAWGTSLRIARRDVLRAKGRSLMVVAMVGLPVSATVMLTSMIATASVSDVESIPARMGTSQALVLPAVTTPIEQAPNGTDYTIEGDDDATAATAADWSVARIEALTGGHVVRIAQGSVRLDDGSRGRSTPIRELDLTDPATRGMVEVVSGRVPEKVDEVTVSPDIADRGVTVGDTVTLDSDRVRARVVGIARARFADNSPALQAFPGTALGDQASATASYLVDRSKAVTWSDVRRLNEQGLLVTSRSVLEDPPPDSQVAQRFTDVPTGIGPEERTVLVIAIVSIVIEVVLLAGPAFAVGVSRQRRQLALVAATGGSAADVQRVVLAQGLVLGVGSAAFGIVVGLVAARLGEGPLRGVGSEIGPFDVVGWQVLAAFLLGSVASVIAAWVPARQAARQDVTAVLAGRRGTTRSRRGWPVLGVVLVVVGVLGSLGATRPGGEMLAAFGTVVVVLGMIALMPALLGVVGRLGGPLPLPLRLAARDSARQRGRTAPAVAAVMGAVAGITALALGSSSDFAQSRRDYEPRYPMGTTVVSASNASEASWTTFEKAVPSAIDGRRLLSYSSIDVPVDDNGNATSQQPSALSISSSRCPTPEVGRTSAPTPECDLINGYDRPTTVADAAAVRALGTSLTDAQARALDDGSVLVGDARMLGPDGRLHLDAAAYDYSTGKVIAVRHLPAVPAIALRDRPPSPSPMTESGGGTIADSAITMSPATAARLDLPTVLDGGVVDGRGALSERDEQRLEAIAPIDDPEDAVYTERGFQETYTVQLIALGGAGFLTVLIGTLTAVGLALSDARPDFATLAAIGARPRTRRLMAAAQALVIGLLGALTGVLVGFVPGWAVSRPLTEFGDRGPVFDVPWLLLGGIGVGVPLLAALAALVLVRSRLPLTRRIG